VPFSFSPWLQPGDEASRENILNRFNGFGGDKALKPLKRLTDYLLAIPRFKSGENEKRQLSSTKYQDQVLSTSTKN